VSSFESGLLIGLAVGFAALALFAAISLRKLRNWRNHARHTLRRIRAARSRLRLRIRRAERLAEIGTLTGGLAHEIKNPLSTVQLNLQLLQEDLDPKDPAYSRIAHRLETVGREAGRLRDILEDFLRFAGNLELRRQDVDLNSILEQLADFFAPQAQLNRVQLRFKPSPQPIVVSVDPRLIKQAILNLMINALQAMNGGGELILTASQTDSPPSATIDVIDTGPGIPPDQQDKIFQAYYSTKKGGTGLGLAMTRRIIEEHHGQIGVRSEPNKGSDFFIRLPMNPHSNI
jgi:two-component system sensor histidine kinase HydH